MAMKGCVVLVLCLLLVDVHAQYCGSSCETGGICFDPCVCDVANNICQCSNDLSYCTIREFEFECYNSSTEICCGDYFSHGNGAICSINNTCCEAFSILVCNNPATSFCCPYSVYAASCPIGNECCGSEYPVCVNPQSQKCCCGDLPCAIDANCNCTTSQCIPSAPCSGCGPEDVCCNGRCFNPNLAVCVEGTDGYQLCGFQNGAPNGVCGTVCYDSTSYTCCSGTLYPLFDAPC